MPPQQTSCSSYQRDSLHYNLDVRPDRLLVKCIVYRYSYRQSYSSIRRPDLRSTVRGAKFYHFSGTDSRQSPCGAIIFVDHSLTGRSV